MVKINGKQVIGNKFVYDGCHKIYIIEDEEDIKKAKKYGYDILYDINELKTIYEKSCPFKFIYNFKLNIYYVEQFEKAIFEFLD